MARQSQGGSVYRQTGRKPPTYVQNYNNTVNAVNNAIKNSKKGTPTYVNNSNNTGSNKTHVSSSGASHGGGVSHTISGDNIPPKKNQDVNVGSPTGGSGGSYGGGYSGNSSATTTTINNTFPGFDAYEKYISEYRAMLEENQRKLDQLAEENYKAQIASNEQNAKDQRNQANLNSARTDRWLNQQYGGGISGKGLTNQLRNQTALNNQIATINQNLASNNSVANLNRYNTLQSNLDNTLTKMASVDDSYLNYLKKLAGI